MERYSSVCVNLSDHYFDICLTLWTASVFIKLNSFTEKFNRFFERLLFELNIAFLLNCEKFVINLLIVNTILKRFSVRFRLLWFALSLFRLSFSFWCLFFCFRFSFFLDIFLLLHWFNLCWFWCLNILLCRWFSNFFVDFSQLRHFKFISCRVIMSSFILFDEFLTSGYTGLCLFVVWLQFTDSQ